MQARLTDFRELTAREITGFDCIIISLWQRFCVEIVSSDYAQPITGQVTEVTCPVIGQAQPDLNPSKRQKTDPDQLTCSPPAPCLSLMHVCRANLSFWCLKRVSTHSAAAMLRIWNSHAMTINKLIKLTWWCLNKQGLSQWTTSTYMYISFRKEIWIWKRLIFYFELSHWSLVMSYDMIDIGSRLVQVMACHLFCVKPLPEPMATYRQMNP